MAIVPWLATARPQRRGNDGWLGGKAVNADAAAGVVVGQAPWRCSDIHHGVAQV